MAVRVLDHTADTGIEATAPSREALVAETLRGMFSLQADLVPEVAERQIEMRIPAGTDEDTLVDALSVVLTRSEIEDLLFCDFQVDRDGDEIVVRAGGVPFGSIDEPSGPAIKAVTYHGLVVEERDDGWFARVYFDV